MGGGQRRGERGIRDRLAGFLVCTKFYTAQTSCVDIALGNLANTVSKSGAADRHFI